MHSFITRIWYRILQETGNFCGKPVLRGSIYCGTHDGDQSALEKETLDQLRRSQSAAPEFWIFHGFKYCLRLPRILEIQASHVDKIFGIEDMVNQQYDTLSELFRLFETEFRKPHPKTFSDRELLDKFRPPENETWADIYQRALVKHLTFTRVDGAGFVNGLGQCGSLVQCMQDKESTS